MLGRLYALRQVLWLNSDVFGDCFHQVVQWLSRAADWRLRPSAFWQWRPMGAQIEVGRQVLQIACDAWPTSVAILCSIPRMWQPPDWIYRQRLEHGAVSWHLESLSFLYFPLAIVWPVTLPSNQWPRHITLMSNQTTPPSKAKRQYLLTSQVRRYCLLALQRSWDERTFETRCTLYFFDISWFQDYILICQPFFTLLT